MKKPSTFIFDLDGTLANGNGRDFYNPTNEEILKDSPIEPVCEVLRALDECHNIIFLSGREAKYYEPTREWIRKQLRFEEPVLFMRKTGDFRKDAIIKAEIYKEKIEPNYEVIACFDDRLPVVKMWYELGVFCFNVNQGLHPY